MASPQTPIDSLRLHVRFAGSDFTPNLSVEHALPTRAQAANYLRHLADQIEDGETEGEVIDFANHDKVGARFCFG